MAGERACVHLRGDDAQPEGGNAPAVFYCGETNGCMTHFPECATCPTCIEVYETRPQPVTTTDLLAVVRLMQDLARRGARIGGGPDSVMRALNALEARLSRPRATSCVVPQPVTRLDRAVVDTTCGKCGGVVPAGDDCQRCYPR